MCDGGEVDVGAVQVKPAALVTVRLESKVLYQGFQKSLKTGSYISELLLQAFIRSKYEVYLKKKGYTRLNALSVPNNLL